MFLYHPNHSKLVPQKLTITDFLLLKNNKKSVKKLTSRPTLDMQIKGYKRELWKRRTSFPVMGDGGWGVL